MKRDLVQWFRQMAVLLNCGISMTGALEICYRQTSNEALKTCTVAILNELRVGVRLSQAMRISSINRVLR